MIKVENLTFRHGHAIKPVINNVSLSVKEGELAVLLGPNGSGKTSLFKCIAGTWSPESGRVLFNGRDIVSMTFRERAGLLAVVPQEHVPPFSYSVFEVVLMGRAPHVALCSAPSAIDEYATNAALDAVGIRHLADRYYTRISGGERQLVLIARALAQEAPLLLLDEPTSHLDFRNQHLVLETVRRVAKIKKLTVLMTLHDPNLASCFAHQVFMIKEGVIVAAGSSESTLTASHLGTLYSINVGVSKIKNRSFIYPIINN